MSRHGSATLDPDGLAAPGARDAKTSAGPAVSRGPGRRAARKKKGLLRRTGVVGPAIGVAVVLVASVTAVAYEMSPAGSGGASVSQFLGSLPSSGAISALEAERQNIIAMDVAAKAMNVVSKPAEVNPAEVVAARQQSESSSSSSSSGSSSSSDDAPAAPAPDPGSAQAIAYSLLPSYGFNQTTQYSCLVSLWNAESGWRWDAENASGAYGIPQALPGSKMASAGSDWQTNPETQIKWGLGYISDVYGTPCAAWDHEEADGWY